MQAGIDICKLCDKGLNGLKRIEKHYLDLFKEWGYEPTSTDQVIRDASCNTIKQHNSDKANRRRADFFWQTESSFKYNILIECDENSHSGIDPTCEHKRLQDVYDQIVSSTEEVKPLCVIRFNPYGGQRKRRELQVKRALEKALQGKYRIVDDRGFQVVELIGYFLKRKQEYAASGMLKVRKI